MSENTISNPGRRAPGLFWPIFLIGVGVIWLLSNLGILTVNPWTLFFRLWPVLFIVIGLDVLFNHSGTWGALLSALLGLLVVAGVIALLFLAQANPAWFNTPTWLNAPALFNSPELKREHIADPVSGARRASVSLGLAELGASVTAVTDSSNLIEGDVVYRDELIHNVSRNGDTAQVELEDHSTGPGLFLFAGDQARWNLGLNPSVEYDLTLNGGSGSTDFDLTQLVLRSLNFNAGSGSSRVHLAGRGQYQFNLNAGSGSIQLSIPQGLAVRMQYNPGSGGLSANNLRQVSSNNGQSVYETPGFSQSGDYAIVNLNGGSGGITVQ